MQGTRSRQPVVAAGALALALAIAGGTAMAAPSAFAGTRLPLRSSTSASSASTAGAAATTPTPQAAGTTSGGATGTSGTGAASDPLCSPALFAAAQQKVEAALSGRVSQLQALLVAINDAPTLSSSDAATLRHDISDVELPGIQALQPQAQAASTCPALRQVARAMVYDYRVYAVMTPQTHLTIVTDDISSVATVFTGLEPAIAQAIDRAQQSGQSVTAAQGAFADLQSKVSSASAAVAGQSATLVAQTPSGAPGNWSVFLTARTNATNARNDLRSAFADLLEIRSDLR